MTVLVADDDFAMRLLIGATIGLDGYDVVEASDGDEAWRLIQEHRPKLALLDVQMPGQTGLDVTRRIRQEPSLAGMTVILVSARTQHADLQAGYDAGADEYVTKPFSPNALAATVRTWVARGANGSS
ncbi:MAG TPA: response regulator [Chloroflexota bacterium]|nr:response regulator [Chloroflexota bacterium]